MQTNVSKGFRSVRLLGLIFAILCWVRLVPLARDLSEEAVTRFGSLTVNNRRTLEFNGRALEPAITGNNSLSLGEPMRLGATDVVLVRDNGGTACPYLYYFVTVSKFGAKAASSFGTCGEISEVRPGTKSISVVMVR